MTWLGPLLILVLSCSGAFAQEVLRRQIDFSGGELKAEMSIDLTEKAGDEHFMHIQWRDRTGLTLVNPGQTIEVELWMPQMGHHSAPTVVEQTGTGLYRVSNMYFIMTGLWQIRVKVRGPLWFEEVQTWSLTMDSTMTLCEN